MNWRGNADERNTITAGCLIATASAVLTGFLLFINGSLMMAVLAALAQSGPAWLAKPAFTQFMLFAMPVLLVFVEWMMIDYIRTRLRQRPS